MTETTTETPVAEASAGRGAALQATRTAKLNKLFSEGRTYTFVRQIDLDEGNTFTTPFGNKGRHGFHIRRTGGPAVEEGVIPIEVGSDEKGFIVGESMLKQIGEQYSEIQNVPVKERKRRTKEQKAADDAAAAEKAASVQPAEAPTDGPAPVEGQAPAQG